MWKYNRLITIIIKKGVFKSNREFCNKFQTSSKSQIFFKAQDTGKAVYNFTVYWLIFYIRSERYILAKICSVLHVKLPKESFSLHFQIKWIKMNQNSPTISHNFSLWKWHFCKNIFKKTCLSGLFMFIHLNLSVLQVFGNCGNFPLITANIA